MKPTPVIDTNSHEFYLMAPPGVELFVIAMGYAASTPDEYAKSNSYISACVPLLVEHEVQAIMQAGVPYITIPGWGEEERLHAHVRTLTDLPYFIDVETCAMAMKALDCSRPVMVSPIFDDERNRSIEEYMKHYEIDVVATARVQDSVTRHMPPPLLPLDAIFDVTKRLFEAHRQEADGIWIAGAAMPSVALIEELERDLQVPVVSSTQALMWAALRTCGVQEPIPHFGRLLDSELQPAAP